VARNGNGNVAIIAKATSRRTKPLLVNIKLFLIGSYGATCPVQQDAQLWPGEEWPDDPEVFDDDPEQKVE